MTAVNSTVVASPCVPSAPKLVVQRLAIVVRDDSFDQLLTPLTFAYEMARGGTEVDVLFVLWAVRALSSDGVREIEVDPRHAHRAAWLRERLAGEGGPQDIHQFLQLLRSTGRVRLHACRIAAGVFGVTPETLLPEADGIVDPGWFVHQVAAKADHCQYF